MIINVRGDLHLSADLIRFASQLDEIQQNVARLTKQGKIIMVKQAELAADVRATATQIAKIGTETSGLKQKVTDLETAVANQDNASQELVDAVAALKAGVQTVDDLVADGVPEVPPVE